MVGGLLLCFLPAECPAAVFGYVLGDHLFQGQLVANFIFHAAIIIALQTSKPATEQSTS